MNNIENLTIVIVTYRTEEKILTECLNSIDPKSNILIVENSKNSALKDKLEQKYQNLSVITSGENLGYGGGNNFGLSKVKTKYALILNPDATLETSTLENFIKEANKNPDYAIIGPEIQEKKDEPDQVFHRNPTHDLIARTKSAS